MNNNSHSKPKQTPGHRILVIILCLAVLAICVVCVLVATQVIPLAGVTAFLELIVGNWVNALIVGGIALVLAILAFALMFSGAGSPQPQSTLVRATDHGVIRISLVALDSMVQKHVRSKNVVREVRSTIIPLDDAISIRLRLVLMPEANVPQFTSDLQKSLREYIEGQSGIRVQDVQIYVDNVSVNLQSRVD